MWNAGDVAWPEVVEIEPTLSCNLRCRMCHVSYMSASEPRPVLPVALVEKLSVLRGKHFILGAGFEPTMNPEFADIVRTLTRFDGRVELITNGTLLDDSLLDVLLDAHVTLFNFSFDGIRPQTYEHIRRGATYDAVLARIRRARERFADRETLFAVNSTMLRSNYVETSEIVRYWDEIGFDMVRLLTMVVRFADPELLRESLFPVRAHFFELLDEAATELIESGRRITLAHPHFETSRLRERYPHNVRAGVVRSNHPRARVAAQERQRHQLGAGPGMSFPCRSPWTFARILPSGDVQLCYQFSVGNLHTQSFEEIWLGEKAQAVRDKVRTDSSVCPACDYYRFCLQSRTVSSDDPENFVIRDLRPALPQIDFEAGLIPLQAEAPPRLVETLGAFNIVAYRNAYWCVPHSFGDRPLTQVDPAAHPEIVVLPTLQQARRSCRAAIETVLPSPAGQACS